MLILHTLVSFLKDKDYRELVIATILLIAVGAIFYRYVEGWRWLDSIYFCVVTLTTIGLGDLTPTTDAGKVFTIFYVIIGVVLILTFINCMYMHYNDVRTKRKIIERKSRKKHRATYS